MRREISGIRELPSSQVEPEIERISIRGLVFQKDYDRDG